MPDYGLTYLPSYTGPGITYPGGVTVTPGQIPPEGITVGGYGGHAIGGSTYGRPGAQARARAKAKAQAQKQAGIQARAKQKAQTKSYAAQKAALAEPVGPPGITKLTPRFTGDFFKTPGEIAGIKPGEIPKEVKDYSLASDYLTRTRAISKYKPGRTQKEIGEEMKALETHPGKAIFEEKGLRAGMGLYGKQTATEAARKQKVIESKQKRITDLAKQGKIMTPGEERRWQGRIEGTGEIKSYVQPPKHRVMAGGWKGAEITGEAIAWTAGDIAISRLLTPKLGKMKLGESPRGYAYTTTKTEKSIHGVQYGERRLIYPKKPKITARQRALQDFAVRKRTGVSVGKVEQELIMPKYFGRLGPQTKKVYRAEFTTAIRTKKVGKGVMQRAKIGEEFTAFGGEKFPVSVAKYEGTVSSKILTRKGPKITTKYIEGTGITAKMPRPIKSIAGKKVSQKYIQITGTGEKYPGMTFIEDLAIKVPSKKPVEFLPRVRKIKTGEKAPFKWMEEAKPITKKMPRAKAKAITKEVTKTEEMFGGLVDSGKQAQKELTKEAQKGLYLEAAEQAAPFAMVGPGVTKAPISMPKTKQLFHEPGITKIPKVEELISPIQPPLITPKVKDIPLVTPKTKTFISVGFKPISPGITRPKVSTKLVPTEVAIEETIIEPITEIETTFPPIFAPVVTPFEPTTKVPLLPPPIILPGGFLEGRIVSKKKKKPRKYKYAPSLVSVFEGIVTKKKQPVGVYTGFELRPVVKKRRKKIKKKTKKRKRRISKKRKRRR